MTEAQIEIYLKATSITSENTTTQNLLKSYYLMRFKEVTKGYGLPKKYFSSEVRCPKCFVEWKKDTKVKVLPLKVSKKQRRKIIQQQIHNGVVSQKALLKSNKIEQICTFCKNVVTTTSFKPVNHKKIIPVSVPNKSLLQNNKVNNLIANTAISKKKDKGKTISQKIENKVRKQIEVKKDEINVYSKTKDIFSLKNVNNTLQSAVKVQKVIKNNKKRKDKYAGLCQQAVLASAKLKEEEKKQNKLNLFLKPSS